MDIIAGIVAVVLYILVSGSSGSSGIAANYKEVMVNSRFGLNETKIINNKEFTWVDRANVKLDQNGTIRDDVGRPYYINSSGHIEIDTLKINQENNLAN